MMEMNSQAPEPSRTPSRSQIACATARWCLRSVIGLNLTLVLLSFSRTFEGTPEKSGVADQLFGRFELGGFRIDFVWLAASTAILAILLFLHHRNRSLNAFDPPVDRYLALAAVVGFFVYLARIFATGLVDFG